MHRFTSTKPSARGKFGGVRVYNAEGLLLVEYPLNQHDPLGYLAKRDGRHRQAFIDACHKAGIPELEVFDAFIRKMEGKNETANTTVDEQRAS